MLKGKNIIIILIMKKNTFIIIILLFYYLFKKYNKTLGQTHEMAYMTDVKPYTTFSPTYKSGEVGRASETLALF